MFQIDKQMTTAICKTPFQSRARESIREGGGHFFRASFARLSKVMVFCGTFGCTGKGYVERETSLASLEREGGTYSGLALLASQKWWFFWHF